MKVRFWDRLLAAFAGLLLFLTGVAVFLWSIRVLPTEWLEILAKGTPSDLLLIISVALSVVMVLLGAHGLSLLFRRAQDRKGFVMQQTEHGQLSISIHAMENLVQKCIDKHQELTVISNRIENTRDGVVVDLHIGLASGISIPLVVNSLQKQIKQYITSCSGIDVAQIKVEVETATATVEEHSIAVPEMVMPAQPKPEEIVPAIPKADDVAAPVPVPQKGIRDERPSITFPEAEIQEKDGKKRPLHQRLFGHKEQPAIIPMPPELDVKPDSVSPPAEPIKSEEQRALQEEKSAEEKPQEAAAEGEMLLQSSALEDESKEDLMNDVREEEKDEAH